MGVKRILCSKEKNKFHHQKKARLSNHENQVTLASNISEVYDTKLACYKIKIIAKRILCSRKNYKFCYRKTDREFNFSAPTDAKGRSSASGLANFVSRADCYKINIPKIIVKRILCSRKNYKFGYQKINRARVPLTSNISGVYDIKPDYYEINIPNNRKDFLACLHENRGRVFKGITRSAPSSRRRIITYYFNGIKSAEDIQNALAQIYKDTTRAFRFYVSFDSIWETQIKETDENGNKIKRYEYFSSSAYGNIHTYEMPFYDENELESLVHRGQIMYYIRNQAHLNHYMERLNDTRIKSYMKLSSLDSSSLPICIYQALFKVVLTHVPLGGITKLPSYIISSNNIYSLQNVDDGDCFWACMALASGSRRDRWKEKAETLRFSWVFYTEQNKSQRKYIGMTLDDIHEYETNVNKDFAINIVNITKKDNNKMEYEDLYTSEFTDRRKVFFNAYLNHLSYIKDFQMSFNKYNCKRCGQVFTSIWHLQRHTITCGVAKQTKYPSPDNSIFKKEENLICRLCREYGVVQFEFVTTLFDIKLHPKSDQLHKDLYKYDYLITFDFESMFAVDHTDTLMSYETAELAQLSASRPDSGILAKGGIPHSCAIKNCNDLATKILWLGQSTTTVSALLQPTALPNMIYVCDRHSNVEGYKDYQTFYVAEHIPTCLAFASNIPGYEKCYIYDDDPVALISRMFEYINKATEIAGNLMLEKMQPLIDVLNDHKAKTDLNKVIDYCTSVPILGFNNSKYDCNLIKKYGFIPEILKSCQEGEKPFVIKNGNQYKEIKTRKFTFLDAMLYAAPGSNLSKYIVTFLGKNSLGKFYFPYELYTCREFLDKPVSELNIEDFYSILKCANTLDDDDDLKKDWSKEKKKESYLNSLKEQAASLKISIQNYEKLSVSERLQVQFARFQNTCKQHEIITVRDLLKYYNEQDVEPLLKACMKQKESFYQFHIDIFKDAVTISGVAQKILSNFMWKPIQEFISNSNNFSKFEPNTSLNISHRDLCKRLANYHTQDVKCNRVSATKRISPDETLNIINEQRGRCLYCKRILGVSPNKDDLWTLDRLENAQAHVLGNLVACCLRCNRERNNQQFTKFYEFRQLKRFERSPENKGIINLIDNEETYKKIKENIVGGPSLVFHRYHEKDVTRIQKVIYNHGKFKLGRKGKLCHKVVGFDANALYLYCMGQDMLCGKLQYTAATDWLLYEKKILSGEFFGCCEVDIEVPEELINSFCDFPPLFINAMVDSQATGDYMQEVFKILNKKHTVEKKLIGSFIARKSVFITPLLKWYLEHGLKVTKLYGVIPAVRNNPFKEFRTWVTTERRKGKIKGGVLAELAKVTGNSAYGGTLLNLLTHGKTSFVTEAKFNKAVGKYLLQDAEQFKIFSTTHEVREAGGQAASDESPNNWVYEVTVAKDRINQNVPVQIGYAILQYAKLRMLEFYYDCIRKYFSSASGLASPAANPEEFQLMHMDTDSFYIALTEELYNKILKCKDSNSNYSEKWFPSKDEDIKVMIPGTGELSLKAFEELEPGLFKTENIGDGEIALTCKTNHLIGESNKESKSTAKGGQKNRNANILTKECYKRSLFDIKTIKGINVGFRMAIGRARSGTELKDKTMHTYHSLKNILTPVYTKAVVMNDGIHIRPFKMGLGCEVF